MRHARTAAQAQRHRDQSRAYHELFHRFHLESSSG